MKRLVAVVVCMVVMVCSSGRSSQAQGPAPNSALARAKQLDQQVEKLYGEGKYAEAIPLAEQSLAIKERELGPVHPDVAESLNNLAQVMVEQGTYAKVEALQLRALQIWEKALDPGHPDVVTGICNLASLYRVQGNFAKAEPLYLRALDMTKKAPGPWLPNFSLCVHNLASLYKDQGDFAKAEPLHLRALDMTEKALGPAHPDVALGLNNLATVYTAQLAFAKAELLLLRALAINEKARRFLHPEMAQTLNNLATLYVSQGLYTKAEPLLLRTLAILEKILPPLHPSVATCLNNLAEVYKKRGTLDRSEPLLLRALAIREQVLGPLHPHTAASLNNLSSIYKSQGAYDKAERFSLRALAIHEKTLGSLHPDVATNLSNLASIHHAQRAFAKAESLYLRTLAIHEKALSPQHPDTVVTLNNLAALYQDQGIHSKAEQLLIRTIAIHEEKQDLQHPNLALHLHNLAEVYRSQGAYAKAKPLFLRAISIREKALGSQHPDVAISLHRLATLHVAQGAFAKAEPLFGRAADIRETQLRTELSRLPEPRKRALMQMLRNESESLVSFHAHGAPGRATALELALTNVLRNKGRVLDSLTDNQAALRNSLTPALRDQLEQLTEARAQLTAQLYSRKEPTARASRRSQLDALRARIDELETSLSAASAEFRSQASPVTIAKVQAELPAGSALVELVRYQRFDARDYAKRWKEERYLAYVLRPSGPPTWVALGEAAPIDAAVEALQAGMHREPGMAQAEIERRQQQARAALQRLHGLLMAPMASSLQGVSHLLIAPDGKLNLVPFEALVDSKGEYVLQRHLVSYLSSGRDLLRRATQRPASSAPTIVAAPDYGPGEPFTALPGALAEGQQLHLSFPQSKLLTGPAASKEALAKLVGPSVLHVATHGFYARGGSGASSAGAQAPPRDPTRGMFIESFESELSMPPSPEGDELDALDRAGLALAGANSSADGIITARELAGLDWSGTQLVVLSACETGVGAVATGEGVYGLRRALVLSGAESQVVSLWNVADASTLALMKTFYAELARGTGRAEALRRAKLDLLSQPQYAHPYYWAPFITAGDWRPLSPRIFAKAR